MLLPLLICLASTVFNFNPLQTSAIQTDVNSVPRSPIIVLHTPYVVNICVRPEATVIVSLLAKGIEIKYGTC
jgi:hypothetical protein